MKKLLKKLPVIAFVLAIVAAFAFNSEVDTVYYRDTNGFHEKTGSGICDNGNFYCTYTYIGSGTPSPDDDESLYQPSGPDNSQWLPDN